MKVLKKQLKHGKIQVLIETPDDLWYCYTLVDDGDTCTGKSEYKFKIPETGKVVKKHVWVSITVDKKEFRQETAHVRISGTVVDGSEDVPRSSHHSIDVGERTEITIQKKRWMDYHLEKLNEAVNSAGSRTLLVLFDRENALFALLRPNGHEILTKLKGNVPKKGIDEVKTASFYKQIVEQIQEYIARHKVQRAVAASPSFWKEYLKKELPAELSKKVIFSSVSAVDESAIGEVLTKPELQKALAGERSMIEEELVATTMDALAKDKLVYGEEDLNAAIKEGNIKELIVTEKKIMETRSNNTFAALESMMRSASDIGGKVHLLSTTTGDKIDGLGGVVGVKRW